MKVSKMTRVIIIIIITFNITIIIVIIIIIVNIVIIIFKVSKLTRGIKETQARVEEQEEELEAER